ncbi:MAG: ABC transporter ATP-binding protein [Meiothermus sp.]|nr:MAG: ABC transporter ATP-binding protein [Meiothermus sp.]
MRNLHKSFPPRKVLRGVSVRLYEGEIVGLLGLNGAGKTTFIKLLAGLLVPEEGQINLLGRPLNPATVRTAVALMKEGQPSFSEFLTPRQCLLYYGHLLGIGNLETRVDQALEMADLRQFAERPLLELSFGTKRKTGLALAYLKGARLLLLDEASAGLDVKSVANLRSALRRYAQAGNTVLLTGHEMGFMEAVCDRVILLHEGRVKADGRLHELGKKYALQQFIEVWYEGEPLVGEVLEQENGLFRLKLDLHELGLLDGRRVRQVKLQQSVLEHLLQEVDRVEGRMA